jgi:hypothetical protein
VFIVDMRSPLKVLSRRVNAAGALLDHCRRRLTHAPSGAHAPAAAGTSQSFPLPASTQRYVAIRAVDAAGNIGLDAVKSR